MNQEYSINSVPTVVLQNGGRIDEVVTGYMDEEVIKIIAMLANKYRLIYQTKLLYQEGKNKYDISKILGVHSYAISLAITTSFKYTDSELIRILKELYGDMCDFGEDKTQ